MYYAEHLILFIYLYNAVLSLHIIANTLGKIFIMYVANIDGFPHVHYHHLDIEIL